MDLYNSSPAARAVWEGADAHLLTLYGFSIIEIVKNNPKEKTIHFSGIKGQAIRQCYMGMTYDTMDKDGHVKTLPLFADIDVIRCPKYIHLVILRPLVYFSQRNLLRSHSSSLRRLRLKICMSKVLFRRIAHSRLRFQVCW
jgi:fatty acid synthase subunit beta